MTKNRQTKTGQLLVASWTRRFRKLGHVYRYIPLAGEGLPRLSELLDKSSMFLSEYEKLNDPFEGVLSANYQAAPEVMRAHWQRSEATLDDADPKSRESRIEQIVSMCSRPEGRARFAAMTRDEIACYRLRCFSETCHSSLMWGHYADGHRGVCLRFRSARLFEGLCVNSHALFMPVVYRKDYPNVRYYRADENERAALWIGTKERSWKYEREWRYVRMESIERVGFPPDALDAVIVGDRVSDDVRSTIAELTAKRPAPTKLLRARFAHNSFAIVIGDERTG